MEKGRAQGLYKGSKGVWEVDVHEHEHESLEGQYERELMLLKEPLGELTWTKAICKSFSLSLSPIRNLAKSLSPSDQAYFMCTPTSTSMAAVDAVPDVADMGMTML